MQNALVHDGIPTIVAHSCRGEGSLARRVWEAQSRAQRLAAPHQHKRALLIISAAVAESAELATVLPLDGRGAPLDFTRASWVADLVSDGLASGAMSWPAPAAHQEEDEAWAEDLPQGYRCADHVMVHSVPIMRPLTAAGHAAGGAALVVCKVSHFRDPETDELDVLKFAAMTNEWSTFTKHASQLQASNYLVQLLGHSKSRTTFRIVSEFCNGGDLQTCVDQQSQQQGTALAPLATPPGATCQGGAEPARPPKELQLQAEGRMSEVQVVRVATHVLKGLATMHRAGITHGDVKPANVFINTEPRREPTPWAPVGSQRVVLKLGDFGTSREKGRKEMHYFVSGFGYSPEYASPEALRHGTGQAGMASDLWSLGVMLAQLLLGRLPAVAVAMAQLHGPDSHCQREAYLRQHPPVQTVLHELDDAQVLTSPMLRHVLTCCLQVAPSMRPVDASALLLFDCFAQRRAVGLVSASSLSSTDVHAPLTAA